jgi:ABC-type sugar transport system ATPase subunit
VIRLADRIVVLKSGTIVGSAIATETSEDAIVEMIVRGRKLMFSEVTTQ